VDRDGVVRALAVLHKLMAHVEATGDHRDGTSTGVEMHQTLSLLIADFEAEASRLSVDTVTPAIDVATDAAVAETAIQSTAETETIRVPPRTPQQ
jgi:hypothetical protein